jgi:hypothetical protein
VNAKADARGRPRVVARRRLFADRCGRVWGCRWLRVHCARPRGDRIANTRTVRFANPWRRANVTANPGERILRMTEHLTCAPTAAISVR